MSRKQRIKKGVDIRLSGRPADSVTSAPSSSVYAVKPPDFTGVIPKLCVRIGNVVEAGSCIYYDKKTPVVQFLSPVAGTVKEIVRGAKRRILAVEIEASENNIYRDFGVLDVDKSEKNAILSRVLEGGMFPYFRQRPFDVIANPEEDRKSTRLNSSH